MIKPCENRDENMNLIKENWNKEDVKEFQEHLRKMENPNKREWATNLLKTKLPVLCLKTQTIKDTVNEICKGNYLSFLDYMLWDYYENTAINGFIISKIKDFDLMKKYLDIYSAKADNWATCDLLSFNIKGNEDRFYNLSLEYSKSEKPFVRRIGMYILFDYITDDNYIDKIFHLLNQFEKEEHYYVNMMNAWLLCECFAKQRNKTITYLEKNKLNKFTINMGIQKCRDSRRISSTDKEMLLKYKI